MRKEGALFARKKNGLLLLGDESREHAGRATSLTFDLLNRRNASGPPSASAAFESTLPALWGNSTANDVEGRKRFERLPIEIGSANFEVLTFEAA